MTGNVSDAVVVGGGIIGLSCACYLARRGATVTLLEKGVPGAETSVTTGGGVRLQFDSRANVELSKLSEPVWDRFEAEFGVDPLFHRIGYLYLARTDATAARLAASVELQRRLGVPSELLSQVDLGTRWRAPDLRQYLAGSFCARDGYLNHYRAVQGFQQGASAAGARIETGVEVTRILREGERVTGVSTTAGDFHAGVVVNAAGPWAPRLAAKAGVRLPFTARRLNLLLAELPESLPEGVPWLYDMDGGVHMRPDGATRVLLGGLLRESSEAEPDAFDRRQDAAWQAKVLLAVERAFGLIEAQTARVIRGWSGLYSGPPDTLPVLEMSLPGLVTVAGFSGAGLMHAPAAGMLVAELVHEGATRSLDISAFSLERFRGPARHWDAAF